MLRYHRISSRNAVIWISLTILLACSARNMVQWNSFTILYLQCLPYMMEIVRALYQLVAIVIPYNTVLVALVVHNENCYNGSVVLVRRLL